MKGMRGFVFILMFSVASLSAMGQLREDADAIVQVLGVQQIEDADGDEAERLYGIIRQPLKINHAGAQKLESSGLFTPYQIASITDYRQRHGDILSFTELAGVDGFTLQAVQTLRRFISLEPSLDGFASSRSVPLLKADTDVKTSLKATEAETADYFVFGAPEWKYSARGKLQFKDAIALSASYSNGNVYSGNIAYMHRHGKVIAGDFNARFGQGLCLWNTAVISSAMAPAAFMRKSAGVSPSYSFTGNYAMSGVAADLTVRKWKIAALIDVPELKKGGFDAVCPAANITRYFCHGHIAATHYMRFDNVMSYFTIPKMRSAVDASLCFRGVNVFGEIMQDWVSMRPSYLSGVQFSVGEYCESAALMRYLPDFNEHGVAASLQIQKKKHMFVMSSDLLYHPQTKSKDGEKSVQLKSQAKWRWDISEFAYSEIRITERLRTWGGKSRTDIRIDAGGNIGPVHLAGRANLLGCVTWGVLGYVEAGYEESDKLRCYLRQGVFRVDDWDDRIYVYERDGPGNFTVPAFYGRGVWTSLFAKWRLGGWGSVYVRAAYTSYPMLKEKKKPGKAELKFQLTLHI